MKMIYVGNLPHQATEAQLQDWLLASGVCPQGIDITRDRFSGKHQGFAIVGLSCSHHVSWAIASCAGETFLGCRLAVHEHSPLGDRSLANF